MPRLLKLRHFAINQAIGISGRAAAALPFLLIAVFLSRAQGLVPAGQFAIALGLSGFAFAPAGWGFRSHIVLDRLTRYSIHDYANARALMALGSAAAMLALGAVAGLPLALVITVIFYRICDMTIDLDQSIHIARRDARFAMIRFGAAHMVKLCLLFAVCGLAWWLRVGMESAIVVAALLSLIVGSAKLVGDVLATPRADDHVARQGTLFHSARWYALAEIAMLAVLSAPRVFLPNFYAGAELGVVGVSLTVSGLFWMAFSTAWIRFFSEYAGKAGRGALRHFLLEVGSIGAVGLFGSWFVAPPVMAWTFRFSTLAQRELSREVLAAGTLFFCGLVLVNLYKTTSRPWAETVAYAGSLLLVGALAWLVPAWRQAPLLLALGGWVLFLATLPALMRVNAGVSPSGRTPGR